MRFLDGNRLGQEELTHFIKYVLRVKVEGADPPHLCRSTALHGPLTLNPSSWDSTGHCFYSRGQCSFSVTGPIVNILGTVGHMISVTTTQLCPCGHKQPSATRQTWARHPSHNFLFTKQVWGRNLLTLLQFFFFFLTSIPKQVSPF